MKTCSLRTKLFPFSDIRAAYLVFKKWTAYVAIIVAFNRTSDSFSADRHYSVDILTAYVSEKTVKRMTAHVDRFNLGIKSFNLPDSPDKEATFIVAGPSRSGTTLITQMLIALGIDMGQERDRNLLEDIPIRRAIREGNWEAFDAILKERNRTRPKWGWKYPASLEHLAKLESNVRNPFFILTFRDPVSIASRNDISDTIADIFENMDDALNYMKEAVSFTLETDHPVLFVSYEKALLYPELLAASLADFIGTNPSEESIMEAAQQVDLNNPSYKLSDIANNYIGYLDEVSWTHARGWAIQRGSDIAVDLELWVDLKRVLSFTSGKFRQDLLDACIGSGKHAFDLEISQFLTPGLTHRIEVRHARTGIPLKHSPATLRS